MGVFNKIFAGLAAKAGKPDQLMIDATHLKAHRTAASLSKRQVLGLSRGVYSQTYRSNQGWPELEATRCV